LVTVPTANRCRSGAGSAREARSCGGFRRLGQKMHSRVIEGGESPLKPAIAVEKSRWSISCFLLVAFGALLGLVNRARGQDTRLRELATVPVTWHHSGPMAFSPDGRTLAIPMNAERQVDLWEFQTGEVRHVEPQIGRDIAWGSDVAFSKDGRFLGSFFGPGNVTVYDVATRKQRVSIRVSKPGWFAGMAFRAGTAKLVIVTGVILESGLPSYTSARWDVLTGKKEETHEYFRGLQFRTISPDGHYVLLQNGREQVTYDSGTGKQVFTVVEGGQSRFSDDGSILVSYDGEQVTRRAVPSGETLRKIEFQSSRSPPGYSMTDRFSVSPNNKLLAIGGFTKVNTVALISLKSGRVLETFECCPPSMSCYMVCFSPNGRILATNTSEADENDRAVKPILKFWVIPDGW
jgi:WD40 repeat protein